jgi:hypothetical protein
VCCRPTCTRRIFTAHLPIERDLAQGRGIRQGSARSPHLPNAVVGLTPLLASGLDQLRTDRPVGLFDDQHGALRQNSHFVAHSTPTGAGVLQADAVRREDDQIDTRFHRLAHNFMRAIAKDDLLVSRHMAFFKDPA